MDDELTQDPAESQDTPPEADEARGVDTGPAGDAADVGDDVGGDVGGDVLMDDALPDQEETVETELPGEAVDQGADGAEAAADGAAPLRKDGKEKITGIFSTQSVQKVGTGTTVRKTVQKTFWMIEEMRDGSLQIQPLNKNYIPSGPKRRIAMDDLLQKFSPEPEFYVHTVFPAMQELNKTVDRGEEHRAKGEFFSAEHEFASALKVDVDNVRANFGLGLTYMERGENKKADNIFERLVKLDAAFEPEHKHLFNEFGINLRKSKMYNQALDYYQRAMQLAQADENLHYNIARAFFEQGKTDQAVKHLTKALEMNPELEAARQFMDWLKEKGFMTEDGEITSKKPSEVASDPKPKRAKQAPKSDSDTTTTEEAAEPMPAGIDIGNGYNVD